MEEQEYTYQLKPLIIPGGVYLVSFPILLVVVWFILKVTTIEIMLLLSIYLVTALAIVALWFYGHSKSFRVEENCIVLKSLRGEQALAPGDIRRIALYKTRKGKEIVQIKTKRKDYYLTDLYFPFPELMADLEQFIRVNSIRTNITTL